MELSDAECRMEKGRKFCREIIKAGEEYHDTLQDLLVTEFPHIDPGMAIKAVCQFRTIHEIIGEMIEAWDDDD